MRYTWVFVALFVGFVITMTWFIAHDPTPMPELPRPEAGTDRPAHVILEVRFRGKPAAGARWRARGAGEGDGTVREGTTDLEGKAALDLLLPSFVAVAAEGSMPAGALVDRARTGLAIELAEERTLDGVVRGGGARVRVLPSSDPRVAHVAAVPADRFARDAFLPEAACDASGRFTLHGLWSGPVVLLAESGGKSATREITLPQPTGAAALEIALE